jgi:hypothetical protein
VRNDSKNAGQQIVGRIEYPQHHENGNRRRGPWQRRGGQRRIEIDEEARTGIAATSR